MVEETIEISVERLPIRLMKVSFDGGYQLVCGGRLLQEVRGGTRTPYPEMPEYREHMFPVNYGEWLCGKHRNVTVGRVLRKGTVLPVGSVRANTLLLTVRNREKVRQWIIDRRNASCSQG